VVIAPQEADRARLQHIHVVLPVEVYLAHWPDVICVRHHKAPRRAVLEFLISTRSEVEVADYVVVTVQSDFHEALHPRLGFGGLGQVQSYSVVVPTVRLLLACSNKVLGARDMVCLVNIEAHHCTARAILTAREATALQEVLVAVAAMCHVRAGTVDGLSEELDGADVVAGDKHSRRLLDALPDECEGERRCV